MNVHAIDYLHLPIYPISAASHHIMLPVSTARSWVAGRMYPTKSGRKSFKPLLTLADPKNKRASFTNLVELFMIQAIRTQYNVPLPQIRLALDFLKTELKIERPLASKALQTDGKYILVDYFGDLLNASRWGQHEMAEVIQPYLDRIDWENELAVRLAPFLRREDSDAIIIDPKVKGGRPCVKGTGITTVALVDRWEAGETHQEIAEDFRIDIRLVEEAIRFEKAS